MVAQDVFASTAALRPGPLLRFLAAELVLLLLGLTLGWKITFLLASFLAAAFFCLISDLGYIYFFMLIAPLGTVSGVSHETIRLLKWAVIGMITLLAFQKIMLTKVSLLTPRTRLTRFMLLFLAWGVVTTFFSVSPARSILELLRISSFFVLFLLVFNTLETKADIRKLIRAWFFIFGAVALYGIWQHFGEGVTRIYSVFSNPNGLGEFCFITAPLVVSLGVYEDERSRRIWYYLIFCLLALTLFLTGSRASWLSTLVAVMAVGILVKKRKLVFSALGLSALVAFAVVVSPVLGSVFGQVTRLSGGLSFRPFLWVSAFDLIKDYPFLGVGLNALGEVLPQYSAVKIPAIYAHLSGFLKSGAVHNFYLQIVAQMGIAGLLLFLYFLRVGFVEIRAMRRREEDPHSKAILTAGFALILATIAHAFFETSHVLGSGSDSTYFWILLGSIYSIGRLGRKGEVNAKPL